MTIFLLVILYLLIGGLLASWFNTQEELVESMREKAREVHVTEEKFKMVVMLLTVLLWLPEMIKHIFRKTRDKIRRKR